MTLPGKRSPVVGGQVPLGPVQAANKRKKATPTKGGDNIASPAKKMQRTGGQTKNSPAAKRYAEVVAALQGAEDMQDGVREMLVNGFGEGLLANSPTTLHPFQLKFLEFVQEALGRVEAKLVDKVKMAVAAFETMKMAGPAFAEAQQAASLSFNASMDAMKSEEENMKEAATLVDDAKGNFTVVEGKLNAKDFEIGAAAMERHQLELMLDDPSAASLVLLEKLLPAFIDEGDSAFSSLVERVREAIASRDEVIRHGAAARVAFHKSLEDARTSLDEAESNQSARREALDMVDAIRYAKAKQLKDAWDKLRSLPDDQDNAEAELKVARSKLAEFQAGPITTVRSALQEPTAALSVEESTASGNGHVMRRRSSWLPRKVKALSIMAAAKSQRTSAEESTSANALDGPSDERAAVDVAPAEVGRPDVGKYESFDANEVVHEGGIAGPTDNACFLDSIPTPSRRSLGTKE